MLKFKDDLEHDLIRLYSTLISLDKETTGRKVVKINSLQEI